MEKCFFCRKVQKPGRNWSRFWAWFQGPKVIAIFARGERASQVVVCPMCISKMASIGVEVNKIPAA